MQWYYGIFSFIILAYLPKSNGGTIGTYPDKIEGQRQGFYLNDPYFGSSYPADHYHRVNYGQYHHHHENWHQRNEGPNTNNHFLNPQSAVGITPTPKVTIRREVADHDFPNYPYEEIRKAISASPLLQQYFSQIPEIGNRGGSADDVEPGESLCRMQTVRIYYPKVLKNINNIEKIIVNDNEKYKQAVEQTRCANEGGKCDIPFDAFGYTSYCEQHFYNRRLLVFENSTKTGVFDEFKVPSCCVCKVKKI